MVASLIPPTITVIRPQGYLKDRKAQEFERDMIFVLTDSVNRSLFVNLELVESIDSVGLRALVSAMKLADDLGRNFRICAISSTVRMILELTQLDAILSRCE
ncbi:MAG: STAS domain-containing protein [Cuspidothrix sp.]